MPKVWFTREHRLEEVPEGTNLKTLAVSLGIDPHRGFYRRMNCGTWGLCGGCQVWVSEDAPGACRKPTLRERWAGMRGQRRLSCQVTILGDMHVTTRPGGDDRLRKPRPIGKPPAPAADSGAARKPEDAAPSAAFIYGHPSAVATGASIGPQVEAAPLGDTVSAKDTVARESAPAARATDATQASAPDSSARSSD